MSSVSTNGVQALALHLLDPGQHGGAAIRRDADGRTAGDHRRDALRISNRGVQRNGAADGDTGERDLAGNAERVHERDEIVDHGVDGQRAADLLRQSGAARVIAQDAPLRGEHRAATRSQLSSVPPISWISTSVDAPLPDSS